MSLEHSPARSRLRNTREASAYLYDKYGIKRSPATLAKQRCIGGGPAYHVIGERHVSYTEPALDTYAVELIGPEMRSTSEAA
jgi:hypothetical protein